MKRVLVNGAGGFIGGHMVKRLKGEGHWVRAVDLKRHEYTIPPADEFILGDLRDQRLVADVVEGAHHAIVRMQIIKEIATAESQALRS
jgi:GDP-D-mannose 3',5'-epimerase